MEGEGTLQRAVTPVADGKLDGPMTEEGVVGELQLLLLAGHDIHRVVKHDVGDPCCSLGHQHGHAWLTGLQEREASEVILMRMRKDRGSDRGTLDLLEKRGGVVPHMLGMQPAIQDHGFFTQLEAVAVGTDASSPGQICETHGTYTLKSMPIACENHSSRKHNFS